MKILTEKQKNFLVKNLEQRERHERQRKIVRKLRRLKQKVKRTPGIRFVSATAPTVLTTISTKPVERRQTLEYISRIGKIPNALKNIGLMVNLRPCVSIDPIAALVLAAELEILQRRHPKLINGIDPVDENARKALDAVGFHQHLSNQSVIRPFPRPKHITVRLRSGGMDQDERNKVPEAAVSIAEVFPDSDASEQGSHRKRRVHAAIVEGLLNVVQHAYASSNPGASVSNSPENERRWWAIAICDEKDQEFWLVVYDRGVGIPNTLKPTVLERVKLIAGVKSRDELLIEAAMEDGRTSRISGGGKGLAQMSDLIEEFVSGSIIVESGKGVYMRSYDEQADTVSTYTCEAHLPGTLVFWRLHFG